MNDTCWIAMPSEIDRSPDDLTANFPSASVQRLKYHGTSFFLQSFHMPVALQWFDIPIATTTLTCTEADHFCTQQTTQVSLSMPTNARAVKLHPMCSDSRQRRGATPCKEFFADPPRPGPFFIHHSELNIVICDRRHSLFRDALYLFSCFLLMLELLCTFRWKQPSLRTLKYDTSNAVYVHMYLSVAYCGHR